MGKEKTVSTTSILGQLFAAGIYKRSQGRIARQVTCGALWVTVAIGAWRLWDMLILLSPEYRYSICSVVLVGGIWLGFRAVNVARFADFLIAVEAEMTKVSWPSRGELFRSSIVVIVVIFALAGVLFGFDLVWEALFKWLNVKTGSP